MISQLNLNRVADLDKTILELLSQENNDDKSLINENPESYFRIIINDSIIIGKVKKTKYSNIISYTGYYISFNTLKKVSNERIILENEKISVITNAKYDEYSKELEDILSETNDICLKLYNECNNKNNYKFPEIKCVDKPNKDNILTIDVNDDFINKFGNKKLKEIRDDLLKKYETELDNYKNVYHENKKLLGKYFMTPYMIGHISEIGDNSCHLYATNVIGFEQDKLTSYIPIDITNVYSMYEIPYNLFQNGQNLLIKLKELYLKLFY